MKAQRRGEGVGQLNMEKEIAVSFGPLHKLGGSQKEKRRAWKRERKKSCEENVQ